MRLSAQEPGLSRFKWFQVALLCAAVAAMAGCGSPNPGAAGGQPAAPADDQKTLNIYNWSNNIAPDTIASFEKLTGVKVHASYFETNEALEARMLAGNSGFDVVFPANNYFQRQIRSGAYLPLDKRQLPNLVNLDPAIMARVALTDPGNAHGIVYNWGTFGIGFNVGLVAKSLPGVAVDSWRLIFDPAYAAQLAPCGINILDSPAWVVRLALQYLGRNPNDTTSQNLADVDAVLTKIRPYVRNIDSSAGLEALANGDICIALEYSDTVYQARRRAREAKNGGRIGYAIPREGSLLWFDMAAIPRDAPHPGNAHLFINYLMNPQVIAHISSFVGNANANAAAFRILDASFTSDTLVYPPPDQQRRLAVLVDESPEQSRAITRIWQKFKAGQ